MKARGVLIDITPSKNQELIAMVQVQYSYPKPRFPVWLTGYMVEKPVMIGSFIMFNGRQSP